MEFEIQNKLVSGEKRYVLIGADLKTYNNLPEEYRACAPYVYLRYNGMVVVYNDGSKEKIICIGGISFDADTLAEFLRCATASGERLFKINKKINDLEKNWNGVIRTYKI